MAWTAPPTFVSGAVLTAAQLNILGADLNETAVGKASAAGQYFVSTAANTVAARIAVSAAIDTAEGTASLTFGDLATVGPTVTSTTGAHSLVSIASNPSNNTASDFAYMSYDVSGASTVAAQLNRSLNVRSAAANMGGRCSALYLEQSLTAGSNTFTARYMAGTGGTANFSYRSIIVMGF